MNDWSLQNTYTRTTDSVKMLKLNARKCHAELVTILKNRSFVISLISGTDCYPAITNLPLPQINTKLLDKDRPNIEHFAV